MLKKLVLLWALAAALAMSMVPALAAEPALGVFDLARFVPFNVSAFISVSTDDAHLAALDGLRERADTLIRDLRASADPMDITRTLDKLLDESTVATLEAALAWSGEAFAIASDTTASGVSQSAIIVPLVDRAAAEREILGAEPDAVRLDPAGRFDIYYVEQQNRYLMIASDLLYITSGLGIGEILVLAGEDYPRLSGVTEYVESVSALPEERYNVGVYLDARRLIETEAVLNNTAGSTQAKAVLDGALAVGATLLNGDTLTLDAAFVPDEPAMPPLSIYPDFARYIPGEMGATIHGADLAALINNLLDAARTDPGTDPRAVLNGVFQMMGLEFSSLFSWTKGDYALYARADLRVALPGFFANPPDLRDLPDALDFGVVIEAVNPDEARAFADSLAEVLRSTAETADNLWVREETINGVAVTVASIDTAMGNGGAVTFDFGVGASDAVFAFGTLDAVRAIFDGGPGLPLQLAYIDSGRYHLPDATTLWVLDGATAVNAGALLYLANLTGLPSDVMTAAQFQILIDRLTRFVRHATISTAVNDDGYTVLRATITLGE
jgi:hypothetical protein